MSQEVDILVDGEALLEDLRHSLETLWGITLNPKSDGSDTWFEFSDEDQRITVGRNTYVNDRDIAFEAYHLVISLTSHHSSPQLGAAWRESIVSDYYGKLKNTRQYHLMLVEGVQHKIDEFDPSSG